jgi:hypothetical protein
LIRYVALAGRGLGFVMANTGWSDTRKVDGRRTRA